MKKKLDRKNYWNNKYLKYWVNKVSLSNSETEKEATPSDKVFEFFVSKLNINPEHYILDMGCGFGRFIPILLQYSDKITGTDISVEMIKEAKSKFRNYSNVNFFVSEAEKTSFENNQFDIIICYGVFDALYQTKALIEFNRILKIGGKILITGKNTNYCSDDEEAMIAEVGAREKKHPNYFTDFNLLLKKLGLFGFEIDFKFFFQRRGDFSRLKYNVNKPDNFYEYLLILKKTGSELKKHRFPEIGKSFSKTFINIQNE